ncbi:MAG: glycolate oxidase subunit GlcF [Gammaproteobacteria bacterium]|nr:glycolate oxidase subunit GlcF [Gammaproteobacteria bacterium]
MRAILAPEIASSTIGPEAEAILRSCVHCGFCNAVCPTYQIRGDERDGPRGRIYLMKAMLEGEAVGETTQRHLDRCLTCRACESACPSGVRYARLTELVKPKLERDVARPAGKRLFRWLLRRVMSDAGRAGALIGLGRAVRGLLPDRLARWVPASRDPGAWPEPRHARRLLCLTGCVQASAAPRINAAAARVLDRLGTSLVRVPGTVCCGALPYHLGHADEARTFARANIDAWWPAIEAGAAGVFSASSGCSAMLRDYADLLADDPHYCERAARVAELALDASSAVTAAELAAALPSQSPGCAGRIAFQPPCTLQHALRAPGRVEAALEVAGFELTQRAGLESCCGSAGTYSLLQPELANELRTRRLAHLATGAPEAIASANIGCMLHLERESNVPVRHWIELVDEAWPGRARPSE